MARRTKEEAEKTYHALLSAAAEAFLEDGVAATTLNGIASRAGVTRGAFYWHFQSKEDLLKALWEVHANPILSHYHDKVMDSPVGEKLDCMRGSFNAIFQRIEENTELGQVFRMILGNSDFTKRHPTLKDFFYGERSQFCHRIEDVLVEEQSLGHVSKEIDVTVAANGLICLISGVMNEFFILPERIDLPRHGLTYIDTYLKGLGLQLNSLTFTD
ncbi:MAG: TetR family transcriptional regulator [Sneathiella sp.]|nr:TetR family transcriptional regulator [Sneathiella sp.]